MTYLVFTTFAYASMVSNSVFFWQIRINKPPLEVIVHFQSEKLPASDSDSAAVWGSKRINPWPQSCLCLTCSGCPSNDDDELKKICTW